MEAPYLRITPEHYANICEKDTLFPTLYPIALPFYIGGFHVTQVSLIITQVKNKIANHLMKKKEIEYRRGVINKQRAKVSGMCDIPNSTYSAKGVFSMETPCWSPSEGLQHGGRNAVETSGV